jgi:hypothetical protein
MREIVSLSRRLKLWKLTSATLGLCFWVSSCVLWEHYAHTRPAVQQPDLGRVYPLNEHGTVVYLNSHEHFLLYTLMVVGYGLILLTGAIHYFGKRRFKEKG